MSYITISTVTFSVQPSSPLWITFKYRKQGDSLWIDAGNVLVPINGILTTPLVITGLDHDTTYEISSQPTNCAATEYIQEITTPEETCPVITDLGTTVSN